MLLAVDIGNSNITLGVYREDELLFVSRLATDHSKTEDQYAIELRDILSLYGVTPRDFDGAIISSVVPNLTSAVKNAVRRLSGVDSMVLGPGLKTGLNIKIDNPAQLGADLAAGAVAALERYPMPCIVFDLGTANTISVLDKSGAFLGGVICPGVGISADALAQKTAQLQHISIEAPESVIGQNTIDCMQSGLVFGAAATLDGLTDRILAEMGTEQATLVATGGIAKLIVPHCRHKILCSDNLLLEGLKIIYRKNRKEK